MSVTIYGTSVALIVVEGEVSEEFGCPFPDGDGALVATSSGHLVRVQLSADFYWKMQVVAGDQSVCRIGPRPDGSGEPEDQAVTIDAFVSWVACGNQWASAR